MFPRTPDPIIFLPHQLICLYGIFYNGSTYYTKYYGIQAHDICHSFNICHSHSEWALQCPAFYKLLPKAVFTKTDKNQTLCYISGNQVPCLTNCLRAKFGCVYAILEVVIAKFFWGSMPPDPPRLMRLWRMQVAAPPFSQPLVHTDH